MEKLFAAIVEWFSQPESIRRSRNVLIFVAVISAVATGVGLYLSNDVVSTPCSTDKYPMRCYRVPKDACEIFWAHTESSCKSIISGLKLSPTRLIGPILFRCQVAKFDQNFSYGRISTPECNEMHTDLEGWKMRNPDFFPQ